MSRRRQWRRWWKKKWIEKKDVTGMNCWWWSLDVDVRLWTKRMNLIIKCIQITEMIIRMFSVCLAMISEWHYGEQPKGWGPCYWPSNCTYQLQPTLLPCWWEGGSLEIPWLLRMLAEQHCALSHCPGRWKLHVRVWNNPHIFITAQRLWQSCWVLLPSGYLLGLRGPIPFPIVLRTMSQIRRPQALNKK